MLDAAAAAVVFTEGTTAAMAKSAETSARIASCQRLPVHRPSLPKNPSIPPNPGRSLAAGPSPSFLNLWPPYVLAATNSE